MMKRTTILSALSIILAISTVFAQDSLSTYDRQIANLDQQVTDLDRKFGKQFSLFKPGKSKFMLRGFFFTGFDMVSSEGETDYNFIGGGINPVLLYKQSERLFFEAEFEGEYENNEFNLGLGYANATFVVNKYITVRGGKFLIPFGSFTEKLHPAWINKMSSTPLGFGHDGIAPGADLGLEVRGAFHIGAVKLNYQAYVINGPQLKTGVDEPEEAGMLKFGSYTDNNPDKAVGGRIGIFPMSNSSLELGFSGMTAGVGDKGSAYSKVRANLFAVDLSYVKSLNFMKSVLDIKAQYNYSQVGDANYAVPDDTTDLFYDFNNVSSGYYVQMALRPSLVDNNFFKRLEIAGRFSALQTPEGSLWEQAPTQWAVNLNYWFNWRTVLKLGYQTTGGLGDHDSGTSITQNMFTVRLAMGF
tara:strand:+ start:101 stop:1342 length:1242 start_codon:yes stop_codon:yes gene_type:complete